MGTDRNARRHTEAQRPTGVDMARKLTSYESVMLNFLPAFRFKAASIMTSEYGMNQQSTASILGVTQASINKYLKGRISLNIKRISKSIDEKSVRAFIEEALSGKQRNAKKYVCTMCQMYKSFNCSLIIK